MPITKNAYGRYTILDSCFQNTNRTYTIDTLLQKVNETLEAEERGKSISLRQLRTDISFMTSNWGFEFNEKEGKKTIYRYEDPNFSIYKQDMAEHHKEAIKTAIEFLKNYTDNHEMLNLIDILETANISVTNQNEPRKIIGLDLNDDYTGIVHKSKLADHIRQRDVLKIEYQSFRASEASQQIFHPQYLKCYNNRWFLIGCNSEYPDKITVLPLDRIKSFKKVSKPAYKEMDEDWSEYFLDMIGVSADGENGPQEVVLRFYNNRGLYVATKPLHNSQKKLVEIAPGIHEVRLKVIVNRELKSQILHFGKDIEVLSPKSLAEIVKVEHEEAFRRYKSKK
jgi:predicted DNA-binding transcriptional regulator YafY